MKRLTRDKTVPLGQRYRTMAPVLSISPCETIVVETINHMTPVVLSEVDLHAHAGPPVGLIPAADLTDDVPRALRGGVGR